MKIFKIVGIDLILVLLIIIILSMLGFRVLLDPFQPALILIPIINIIIYFKDKNSNTATQFSTYLWATIIFFLLVFLAFISIALWLLKYDPNFW
jgi:hypothetical protein